MIRRLFLSLTIGILFLSGFVAAQVATKTGSIYGKVTDDNGDPLPGVTLTLESATSSAQVAVTGPAGSFRFAQLVPAEYSIDFEIEGFVTLRQESIRITVGSEVQLDIKLKPALTEEFVVIGETPLVDARKTGASSTFSREYLDSVPSARDPWVIIDQTTGVDADRYNVAGSESGQQAAFLARGGLDDNNVWNYDGVNVSDPGAIGGSPTYYDFDAFEELQISTGGNDVSIPTGGVAVNIVTKRAGNKWEASASYFYAGEGLQADNTPDELAGIGAKSNRLDEVKDYGFDLGGPVLTDRIFIWGAYRRNEIGTITTVNNPDFTKLEDLNLKSNFTLNTENEFQFGYFRGEKTKSGRAAISVAVQAPETLWDQSGAGPSLKGVWTGQHTWIPSDRVIVNARYGYVGNGFSLIPAGGNDKPMIFLQAIPRYEDTMNYVSPIDRPSHDFVVDTNYYKDGFWGGDHEFKFGFEYKTAKLNTFSSYGNGIYIVDQFQTTPRGPLTSGVLYAIHSIDGHQQVDRASAYFSDTYRRDRLTLNLGFRFDRQSGKNLPSTVAAVPGFESFVGPFVFDGNDPGLQFNDLSPRIGVSYDLTGDGKTVVRGNVARYYDTFDPDYLKHVNPAYTLNGAIFSYNNLNGDRTITPDELTSDPSYFGGLNGPVFDVNAFNRAQFIEDNFKNSGVWEYILGFERELMKDLSVSAGYTHRDYFDTTVIVPFGITSSDFVPAGTYTANTILGRFDVPYFVLGKEHDGRLVLRNVNDYKTSYDGLDLVVRKRMSDNFMLNGSLSLQRQKASYDGGDSLAYNIDDGGVLGQTFPFDPSNLPFLDGQTYAFAPLASGKAGVYPFAEWQLKISGVYQLPFDISAGAFARYQQGYPFVLFGTIFDPSLAGSLATVNHLVLVEPFGSRRFDNVFTLDLQLGKSFELGQYGKINLAADIFNVTNTNTVIRRTRNVNSVNLNRIDEVISPRVLRLGLRYNF